MEARIIAVADVFDALTTKRSYRDSLSFQKATGILDSNEGENLDPTLVDIFLKNIREKDIKKGSG